MALRKAQRKQAKIRLGLASPSGGGKTYSALLIAKGLVGSWDKVAIIDTENFSADLYANLGDFNVLSITAPYNPQKYIDAIKECEDAGMECPFKPSELEMPVRKLHFPTGFPTKKCAAHSDQREWTAPHACHAVQPLGAGRQGAVDPIRKRAYGADRRWELSSHGFKHSYLFFREFS